MDFGEMFRVMRRRWFVAVPALLLTVIAVAGAYLVFPTKYQVTAQLSLLSSQKVAAEPGNGGNPYLSFDTSLIVVDDILGRNLSSTQSAQQLNQLGVTEAYTAGIAQNAQGPFLALTVIGPNRAHTERSMATLISFAQRRLAQLQEATAAPQRSLIRSTVISPPSAASPVLKSKIQLIAGIAVLGLILSVLLTFITDSVLTRRAARSERRTGAGWADAGPPQRLGTGLPTSVRSQPRKRSEPARMR